MTIKPGDSITWHGTEYEITSSAGNNTWWIKASYSGSQYYYLTTISQEAVDEGFKDGTIRYGRVDKIYDPGRIAHLHVWKLYQGATQVDEFCECGAKREVNWRDLGESTDKNKGGLR